MFKEMKFSVVITCDSRAGWLDPFTSVRDRGDKSLPGCRSVDFMLSGVENKLLFVGDREIELLLFIDEREPISYAARLMLGALGHGTDKKIFIAAKDHSHPRWNDKLYHDALKHATGDYVIKFDGDVAAFHREGFDAIGNHIKLLDQGYRFICQPTQIENHGMRHASTRYFICKRESLNFPELERCMDDHYRVRRYQAHLPCYEHFLGVLWGPNSVLYPPADNKNYLIWSWVEYHRGVLEKLNKMTYDDVYKYVFETCGGVHGASDLMGANLS